MSFSQLIFSKKIQFAKLYKEIDVCNKKSTKLFSIFQQKNVDKFFVEKSFLESFLFLYLSRKIII